MPRLVPKKFSGRIIAQGERAIVVELDNRRGVPAGTLARINRVSRHFLRKALRDQEPVKEMFYKFKIARKLFPKNFPQVYSAQKRQPGTGDVLLSKKVALDELSTRLVEQHERNWVVSNEDWVMHTARVKELANPIARKMRLKGVIVNTNPWNVWFDAIGNPVFFDIRKIGSLRIRFLNTGGRKLANGFVKRYKANKESE